MPSLAALLPESVEDSLGTRGVLEDALKFSRLLHGAAGRAGPEADAYYRSFVPKLEGTVYALDTKLAKRCRLELDHVGATLCLGLVKILPLAPRLGRAPREITKTVTRRAQVICECALRATCAWWSPPPSPTM